MKDRFLKTSTAFGSVLLLLFMAAACAGGDPIGTEVGDGDGDGQVNIGDGDGDGDPDGDGGEGDPDGDGGEGDPDGDSEEVVCDSNDDCDAPEICVRSEPGAEGVCGEATDTREDGESCSNSNQCESGLCHDQTCTRECADAADCADGWICRDQGGVGVCEEPTTCTAAGDCEVAGDLCVVERNGDLRVICHPPVGDGEIGDTCSGDEDCEAGLCLDGMCSNPCDSPSDCGGSGDFRCSSEDLGGTDLNVCTERPLESCLSDAECDGTDRCVAGVRDDDFLFACGDPNDGGAEGGESCSDDGDCAQNLCLDGACAAPCDTDAVCSTIPASSCGSSTVEREGVEGSVSTCDVPELCDNSAQCSGSETCYVVSGDSSVDTICNEPNSANRGAGEFCSSNSQCASNYCHEGRFATYCAEPCANNSDCPSQVEGYQMECGTADIEHGSGSEAVAVCVHSDPAPCALDGDCGTGESCAFAVTSAGSGVETVCLPTAGGGGAGASCTSDPQCGSRYCVDGSCSAPCASHDMCAGFQLCQENTVTKDGEQGVYDICEDIPIQSCNSSVDCSPSDALMCNSVIFDADGDVEDLICWRTNDGGDGLGSSCTQSSTCESDFCWTSDDNTTGECTVFCEEEGRDCAGGQVCAEVGADIRTCLGECSRNADCDGGNICALGINETNTAVHTFCIQTLGDGETGDACTPGAGDCKTGLCLTITSDDGTEESRCSEICNPANGHADCQGGHELDACSEEVTVTWDGGQEDVAACTFGME